MSLSRVNEGDEVRLVWRYDTAPWESSFGMTPESTTGQSWALLQGVDCRVQGSLRRYPGHLLMQDLSMPERDDSGGQWLHFLGVDPSAPIPGLVNSLQANVKAFKQVIPFTVTKGTSEYRITGFVIKHASMRVHLRPYQLPTTIASGLHDEWFVPEAKPTSTEGYDFVSILTYDEEEDQWAWWGIRQPGQYTIGTTSSNWNKPALLGGAAPNYWYVPTPDRLTVTTNGRFLYIFTSGEDEPLVLWNDAEKYPRTGTSWGGWHWEAFGPGYWGDDGLTIPEAHRAFGTSGTGWLEGGSFQYGVRPIDYYRGRFGGLTPLVDYLVVPSSDDGLAYVEFIVLRPDATAHEAIQYEHLELFRTVVNLAEFSDDSLGGQLYSDAVVKSYASFPEEWKSGQSNYDNHYMLKARLFNYTTRFADIEDAGTSTYAYAGLYDGNLVLRPAYDYNQDVCGPNPTSVLAAASHQGCTVVASKNTTTDQEGSLRTEVATSKVVLRWSATHVFAPENFPPANQYFTQISASDPVVLFPVGDYLLCVGNGGVVRWQRQGQYVDIVELTDGGRLLGWNAAVPVKGQLFAIFQEGAYLIDPASGSREKIVPLDRVVRDMWPGADLQCVYDPVLDAILIHNDISKETCFLWLGTQTISFNADMSFDWMRTAYWAGHNRTVFITPTGRFVATRTRPREMSYSRFRPSGATEDWEGGSHLGLPLRDATTAKLWITEILSVVKLSDTTLKITTAEPLTLGTDWTDDSALNIYRWYGQPIRVLTGNHLDYPLMLSHFNGTTLYVARSYEGEESYLAPGDVIAFGGVPLLCVGSPLGISDLRDLTSKRHAKTMCPVFSRVMYPEVSLGPVDDGSSDPPPPPPPDDTTPPSGPTGITIGNVEPIGTLSPNWGDNVAPIPPSVIDTTGPSVFTPEHNLPQSQENPGGGFQT